MSKKSRLQEAFLTELKKVPIVSVASENSGITRNIFYRWKREDKKFSELIDEALAKAKP